MKKLLLIASSFVVAAGLSAQSVSITYQSDFDGNQNPLRFGGAPLTTDFTVELISLGGASYDFSGSQIQPSDAASIFGSRIALDSTQWSFDVAGSGLTGFWETVTFNASNPYPAGAAGTQGYIFIYNSLDFNSTSTEWLLITNNSWTFVNPAQPPPAVPAFSLANAGNYTVVGSMDGSDFLAAQVIPEPSTYALIFGLGILGFLGYRRVRK